MRLLALNTTLPQRLHGKYQLALAALPTLLMFVLPIVLVFVFLSPWFEAFAGLSPNKPVRGDANATFWVWMFVAALTIFLVLGYVLGWLVNAAISRFLLGWPVDKVSAVYLRSEVPAHWLKDDDASLPKGKGNSHR